MPLKAYQRVIVTIRRGRGGPPYARRQVSKAGLVRDDEARRHG